MEEPQNPPASGGTRTFGIHKYNPEYCLGSETQREKRRRGYEDKYEDDALYEELSDDARIWRVMLDEGRVYDTEMLQRLRDHLDVDLVFAGLFSAVLTTFVVQTSQTPSSTGDTTISLLLEIIAIQRAWANDPRVNDVASFSLPPPTPAPSPWINRFWYLSLIFSLLAAFGAVVVRQWLQEFESEIIGPPKRRALVRHFRRIGLENYNVHLIVPILPMLLHVSLLLFFIGLTLYVRQSDRYMSNGIIALTATIYFVYLATNLMPVFRPQCPYRSPLSTGAQWARSLVALLYALLPIRLKTEAPLALLQRCISATTSLIEALARLSRFLLPTQIRSFFSSSADMVKHRLLPPLRNRLRTYCDTLRRSWNQVSKAPDAHEWEAMLNSSDTMIPNSLDSMAQASSDLSVTPLIVQASSNILIDPDHYGDGGYEDPRYSKLLRHRIRPWFVNALRTRRTVFDWTPGRENELQRMACALLLAPMKWTYGSTLLWKEVDTAQYCACISGVLQALTAALLDLRRTPTTTMTDAATLSMTLLALGKKLADLDPNSKHLPIDAPIGTIAAMFSSLPESPPFAVLHLRPVIWHHALRYLNLLWTLPDDAALANFAIALWRNAYSDAPFPDDNQLKRIATLSRVTLQEWLYLCPTDSRHALIGVHRILCPQSCEAYDANSIVEPSDASRLHMACHAIDSYTKADDTDGAVAFKDNLGFLAAKFTESLLILLEYQSIDSALRTIGHSAVSAAFKSTFLVRPYLSLARFVKTDLPATFAASLFWFLAKIAEGTIGHSGKAAVLKVLNRHATHYCDVLAEVLDYDKISIELLLDLVSVVLDDPQMALLDITDVLAASLATQLRKVAGSALRKLRANSMHHFLYLDALCAARANSKLVDKRFPDASRTLHSALLSLDPTYHDTWKSELTRQLKQNWFPLAVAFALKSTHGCEALAEWVDDLPALMQDPRSGLEIKVPAKALNGADPSWYRHFTSDPDKYICAPDRPDIWKLHIRELVSFEEAVKWMQRSGAERAAKEAQGGDDADAHSNDDAESPDREHGVHEDQGDAERMQKLIIARLRAIGAWGAAPFKSTRAFLARLPGLRQVGESDPSSSIALGDIEQIAGISVALDPKQRGGGAPIPARTSEGGQDGAWALDDRQVDSDEQGQTGEGPEHSAQAQNGQKEREDEQAWDGEVSRVQTREGICARDDAEDAGEH